MHFGIASEIWHVETFDLFNKEMCHLGKTVTAKMFELDPAGTIAIKALKEIKK